jgi:acetoin utilization deacetylase AcuC-like enzyme
MVCFGGTHHHLFASSVVSAGFDAAAGDDLGECYVTPAGYAHMTHMLSGLANGRLVVALEVCMRSATSREILFADHLHVGRL